MPTYMFSYGMNTNAEQMAARCPRAIPQGHAILPGHLFRFAGCADIVTAYNHQVDGVLWEITSECRAAIDLLEGYPDFYNAKTIMVKHHSRFVSALVYYMNPGYSGALPSARYLDIIRTGYETFNVPQRQINLALGALKIVS